MSLGIVGVGLSRTGTLSLKRAIEQLGLGPCFHCLEGGGSLVQSMVSRALNHLPLDWNGIFCDYNAAVDIPFSWFYSDIIRSHPAAKFILTIREPSAWYESFLAIRTALDFAFFTGDPGKRDAWLGHMATVLQPEIVDMLRLANRESVIAAYERHTRSVRKALPADRLLVLDVRCGWRPLCEFLEVPIPAAPFPHVNSRSQTEAVVQQLIAEQEAQPQVRI